MNKIEREMNQAITNEVDWHKDNTAVSTENGVSTVTLHGHKIAEVGDTWLRIFDAGWRTNTTKSRLNAILRAHGNGESVFQKEWQWFISTAEGVVEFEDGFTLRADDALYRAKHEGRDRYVAA